MRCHRPIAIIALLIASSFLPAQDLAKQVPSLKWVPLDAGSYSVMLRNKEQLDIILKSKAWAKLTALPFAKMLRQTIEDELNGGNLQPVRDAWNNPAAADGLAILAALFSDEIFVYSDKNNADFILLVQELFSANQTAPLRALLKGDFQALNNPLTRVRSLVQVVNDNAHRIKFPDNVIGFRVGKANAVKLAKMLDDASQLAKMHAPPPIKERINTIQIHGSDVHTLTLDGQLIPWEMISINKIEDRPGEFNKLVKHLKELKLTIALNVRDEYLLLSVGEGTAGLKALGAGPALIGRAELAPLTKFAGEKLTNISYVAKDYLEKLAGNPEEDGVATAKDLLKDTELTAAQKAQILKDVKMFYADIRRLSPTPGAQLSFSFLTAKGFEGYDYDWAKNHGLDGSKPLTILNHVGGQPIAFGAGRAPTSTDGYEALVKWVVKAYDYFEKYGLPRIPDDEARDHIGKFLKEAKPLFARLDKATGKLLLPSLDGQAAIVLDGKLSIMVPGSPQPLPAPELGIVVGLTDADMFRKAFQEYRDIANGFIAIIAKIGPVGGPEFKVPPPETKKVAAGTLYFYPLPDVPGLDPQIAPTAGVSSNVAVFSLSQSHAAKLMTKTPLKTRDGSLAEAKRPLVAAAYFDWIALIDAAAPWADEGMRLARAPGDVVEQVEVVLDILKVFRGYSSVTYLEQGAMVTHSQSIFRDVAK